MILCVDRKAARTVFRYCRALLMEVPALAALVERADDEVIDLSSGVSLEIMTASLRSLRGYTCITAIVDEIAFLRTEETSANPDHEIVNALRPAQATIPGAMMLFSSSPYAKRGELYTADRKYYGVEDSPVLVWKTDTLTMHPDHQVRRAIDNAYERDPVAAASEFGRDGTIGFRTDIETYVSPDAVDGVVVRGRQELARGQGIVYSAFVDAAGGSGGDSMTLAISHITKDGLAVLDCLRERRPPFSPEAVVREFAATAKSYGVCKITGDHWGGEFVREPFRSHGIEYSLADRPKSDFYRDLLPLINSGKVELLDHPRLISQLCALERRTARSGKDSIDHAPNGHDDLINSAAGALVGLTLNPAVPVITPEMIAQVVRAGAIQRSRFY